MPWRLPTPCRQPGCHALVDGGGYCEPHKQKRDRDYNAARKADPNRTDAFYKTAAWRALRALRLNIEPVCRNCKLQGRVTPANTADHIVPIRQGGAPLDLNNTQSLCGPCHASKSALEGSRWG